MCARVFLDITVPLLPTTSEDKTKLARLQKMLDGQKQEWEFAFCFDGSSMSSRAVRILFALPRHMYCH